VSDVLLRVSISHNLCLVLREEVAKHDKLKKNYDDPTFEVVSSVFRALAQQKIVGSGSFQRFCTHFTLATHC
jgi:hypothetical protein